MDPELLRAWFEDYLAACNRHDLADVRALLHPDVRRAHRPRGADAWIDDLAARLTTFPDLQWKRIALVIEGDRLAAHLRVRGTVRGTDSGTVRGVLPGVAAGRRFNAAEFGFYRVVGGLLTEYAGTDDGGAERALDGAARPTG